MSFGPLDDYRTSNLCWVRIRVLLDSSRSPESIKSHGNLIVVEDHWIEGGLGSAVLQAFAGTDQPSRYTGPKLQVINLAVRDMPGSGQPEELLHAAKIDAAAIVEVAKSLLKQPVGAVTR